MVPAAIVITPIAASARAKARVSEYQKNALIASQLLTGGSFTRKGIGSFCISEGGSDRSCFSIGFFSDKSFHLCEFILRIVKINLDSGHATFTDVITDKSCNNHQQRGSNNIIHKHIIHLILLSHNYESYNSGGNNACNDPWPIIWSVCYCSTARNDYRTSGARSSHSTGFKDTHSLQESGYSELRVHSSSAVNPISNILTFNVFISSSPYIW